MELAKAWQVATEGGGDVECPRCGKDDGSCGVFHSTQDGRWWVKCHRAACGFATPLEGSTQIEAPPVPEVKYYRGRIQPVPEVLSRELVKRHPCLSQDDVALEIRYNPDRKTLLFPFWKHRTFAGFVERAQKPKDGYCDELAVWTDLGPSWKAKSKTWYDSVGAKGCMAWYGNWQTRTAVLVEDCLSAIVLAAVRPGLRVVAALGTGLNRDKIQELYAGGVDHLRIAFDADATGQAFHMASKWGMGFDSCRVIPLDKDIKNMVLSEVHALRV